MVGGAEVDVLGGVRGLVQDGPEIDAAGGESLGGTFFGGHPGELDAEAVRGFLQSFVDGADGLPGRGDVHGGGQGAESDAIDAVGVGGQSGVKEEDEAVG